MADYARGWNSDGNPNAPPRPPHVDKCLAVYALRQLFFRDVSEAHHVDGFEPIVEMIEAPYESNPRLAAQRGVFTLLTYRTGRKSSDYKLPSLDELVERLSEVPRARGNGPYLRKLTLPHSQAPQLLRLLDGLNVNATTIDPTYDGAVKAMREKRWWA